MKLKKNIALSDTGFVFDPSNGNSFSTNPIGLEIIQLLKQNKTQSEIETKILSTYEVDKNTFEKDYYDFVNMLGKLKLNAADEKD
ncbi:MAG: PqqD family protein [Bacteroidia bacterium]|nr:PqqD family protein [Bacteroidia bacterium]